MTDIIYKKMSHSFLVWSSKNIDEPEYSYIQEETIYSYIHIFIYSANDLS